MPFKYAPPVAVLFAPFALAAQGRGRGAVERRARWCCSCSRCRGSPASTPGPRDADGSWAALALAGPVGTVLFYGQVDLWLLGLITLAAAAATHPRRWRGGARARRPHQAPRGVRRAVLPRPPALAHARHRRRRWSCSPARCSPLGSGPGASRAELTAWREPRRAEHRRVGHRPEPAGPPHARPRRRRLARDAAQPRDALARPARLRPLLRRAGAGGCGDDAGAAFRMTSPRRRHVLAPRLARELRARPARVRRLVTRARQGDVLSPGASSALVVAGHRRSPPACFLDRTATERLLAFRPWGLLGLLLVVVEFSAPRARVPVRAGTAPG